MQPYADQALSLSPLSPTLFGVSEERWALLESFVCGMSWDVRDFTLKISPFGVEFQNDYVCLHTKPWLKGNEMNILVSDSQFLVPCQWVGNVLMKKQCLTG